jgi:hypothetical protein
MFASHTHKPEAYFLDLLWSALERLYIEVKAFEKEELAKLENETKTFGGQYKGFFSSSFGSAPNDVLITNDFVWYASSAACFLQLFDHSFDLAGSYRTAFPAMLKWRDKVSAHPAIAVPIAKHNDPGKIDSPESQAASIMMHPEWHIDHYTVGGFIIGKPAERSETAERRISSSHRDWKWSLTRIHREIEAFAKKHL